MSLSSPLSYIFYGIQLGAIDATILVCLVALTTEIPDKDGRMICRGFLFLVFLCAQLIAGATNVDKGGEFWNPVLQVGYVVLGVMIGGLGVHRVYGMVNGRGAVGASGGGGEGEKKDK